MYVVYATREQELYDLVRDPYELRNAADHVAYAQIRSALRERLAQLCRPRPPGFDVHL
jgi:hypothetical protein